MKKFKLLSLSIILLSTSLFGQEDNFSYYTSLSLDGNPAEIDAESAPMHDFTTISGSYDWILKSDFRRKRNKGGISFAEADVDISYTHIFNSCEGASVGLGYSTTHLGWDKNPFFSEQNFNNLIFSLGGYSKRFYQWDWKGYFSAAVDTREWNFQEYGLYTYSLWGRYSLDTNYFSDLGLNIGFVGRSGLDQTLVWPIVGIDYKMNQNWKLNLVYPVNMSVVYSLSNCWSFAIAGKMWNSRHRTSKNEGISRGIFEYRNIGAEFAINYDYDRSISANLHVGSTIGQGDLKIMNRNGSTIRHNKFNSAGYVGGGFDFRF